MDDLPNSPNFPPAKLSPRQTFLLYSITFVIHPSRSHVTIKVHLEREDEDEDKDIAPVVIVPFFPLVAM